MSFGEGRLLHFHAIKVNVEIYVTLSRHEFTVRCSETPVHLRYNDQIVRWFSDVSSWLQCLTATKTGPDQMRTQPQKTDTKICCLRIA